jgi:hypothetical protein
LGDLQEFYAGEDDMGSSIAPGMAKLVGDAPVWKRTQSLGCNRRAGDIARQSFKPRSVVSVYRDSCMETEALHAGAALPRGNSVLQRGCGTGGEQRVFIQQRAFGCSTMIREQAATLKEAEMMPLAVAAATRADLVVVGRWEREELGGSPVDPTGRVRRSVRTLDPRGPGREDFRGLRVEYPSQALI